MAERGNGDGTESGAFQARRPPPWALARGLPSVLSSWRDDPGVARCFSLDHTLKGKDASFGEIPAELHPRLVEALRKKGIQKLYSHQSEAFGLAKEGRDVVVSTPTASGKSLC